MNKCIFLIATMLLTLSTAQANHFKRLTHAMRLVRTSVVNKIQEDPKSAVGGAVGGVVAYNLPGDNSGVFRVTKNVLLGMGIGYIATKKSQSIMQRLKNIEAAVKNLDKNMTAFRGETKDNFKNVGARFDEQSRSLDRLEVAGQEVKKAQVAQSTSLVNIQDGVHSTHLTVKDIAKKMEELSTKKDLGNLQVGLLNAIKSFFLN